MMNKPDSLGGFSLVQLSIVLTVISLLAASALPGGDAASAAKKNDITVQRMIAIEQALRGFRAGLNATTGASWAGNQSGRIPCPADGTLDITHANFGKEVDGPGVCAAANFIAGNVALGVVPVRTLQLPDEYALDGFGRRFSYVVDIRATRGKMRLGTNPIQTGAAGAGSVTTLTFPSAHGLAATNTLFISGAAVVDNINVNGNKTVNTAPTATTITVITGDAATAGGATGGGSTVDVALRAAGSSCYSLTTTPTPGDITITTIGRYGETTVTQAMVALISHGANGHGAFSGHGSAIAARTNAGITDADELENASQNPDYTNNFNASFIKKVHTSSFDDIVRYGTKCQ